MDILYESLCPDSRAFISEQLSPLYQEFKQHLEINLVPFGKSSSQQIGDDYAFECQHGPDECFGNRVQGCILSRIPDQDMVRKKKLLKCN